MADTTPSTCSPGTLVPADTCIPTETIQVDIVVVGGGMTGVCAAIAAARHGANTVLVQNRPVLGGNASSEIGVPIVGASCSNGRWDSRETGILEEIQLASLRFDPLSGPAAMDAAMWEAIRAEPRCRLLLNTHITEVQCEAGVIKEVRGDQQGSEMRFNISGTFFMDCTGDGTLSVRAGCRAMIGREAKSDFNEPDGLDVADNKTMGNTIYWETAERDQPTSFTTPSWAKTYTENDLRLRPHPGFLRGFWWLETGGDVDDTIRDNEAIRDELWQIAFGLWDHVKNVSDHGADNHVLHRVGSVPGKRESRRIIGDYVLKQEDLITGRIFDDAVAYGGWTLDLHVPGGIRHLDEKPTKHISTGLYTIPWRSLIAADCTNLLIGGRLISATHLASSSARVMGTCAVIGQAMGTGAAMAIEESCDLRTIGTTYIAALQQRLLRDDAFLPRIPAKDPYDRSPTADIIASSAHPDAPPERLQDGWQRNRPELRPDWIANKHTHPPDPEMILPEGSAWISAPLSEDPEPFIEMCLPKAEILKELRPLFDSHLSRDLPRYRNPDLDQGMPITLVRDYELIAFAGEKEIHRWSMSDNRRRNPIHTLPPDTQPVDRVRLIIKKTWGGNQARVFALRLLTDR